MKKLALLIQALLIAQLAYAQITFQKAIGGTGDNQGYCVLQTTDGGYILAGKSNNFGLGYTDIFIIKTDANGDTLWTKEMGSIGIDLINSVKQTSDGGFIFAGVYAPPPSTTHAFLMKTDSIGNILWTHAYGNSFTQDAKCVQQTSDGGYIFCGNIVGSTGTANDFLLLKTDSTGSTTWAKNFQINNSQHAYYLEQTNDGGFIFTGFAGAVELVKTDGSGNFVWSKDYGNGTGNCVHQTTDGGYVISGYAYVASSGSEDIILKKTDNIGNLLWAYRYGGINSEKSHNVTQTTDGGYIISGTTTVSGLTKLLIIKTDSAGTVMWSKVFGSSGFSEATSVQQTTDGGYIILGKYGNATNNSMYLVKTDSIGTSGCNQADTTVFMITDTTQATTVTMTSTTIFVGNPVPAMTVIGIPPSVTFNSLCFSNAIMEQAGKKDEITLAPNPSSGNFTITFNTQVISGTIEVINALGENVYGQKFSNTSVININLNKIVGGIYFVKVFNEKINYCKKLVIEHN